MEKQQWFQEFKLAYGKVSGSSCLLSFLAQYTNTNMSCHYHCHVIRSITNSQSRLSFMLISYESNNVSLLLWRNSARQYNIRSFRNFKKIFFEIRMAINNYKACTCNYNCLLFPFILRCQVLKFNFILCFIDLCLYFMFCKPLNYIQIHLFFFINKPSRLSNINSCLNLIACQNPYLDASIPSKLYGVSNLILESIFNCC